MNSGHQQRRRQPVHYRQPAHKEKDQLTLPASSLNRIFISYPDSIPRLHAAPPPQHWRVLRNPREVLEAVPRSASNSKPLMLSSRRLTATLHLRRVRGALAPLTLHLHLYTVTLLLSSSSSLHLQTPSAGRQKSAPPSYAPTPASP